MKNHQQLNEEQHSAKSKFFHLVRFAQRRNVVAKVHSKNAHSLSGVTDTMLNSGQMRIVLLTASLAAANLYAAEGRNLLTDEDVFGSPVETCESKVQHLNVLSETISRVDNPSDQIQIAFSRALSASYKCAGDLSKDSKDGTKYTVKKSIFGSTYELSRAGA